MHRKVSLYVSTYKVFRGDMDIFGITNDKYLKVCGAPSFPCNKIFIYEAELNSRCTMKVLSPSPLPSLPKSRKQCPSGKSCYAMVMVQANSQN